MKSCKRPQLNPIYKNITEKEQNSDVSSEFLLKQTPPLSTGTLTSDILKDYWMIFLIVVTQTILE